ncbi:MBL fold metallo-hydrolase [Mycolicibacterium goodii]|uniref:Beta-lactamase n=1 Tax=Mycolicibacterium goodii TaxID=134601 RepID=A0A0K0XGL3_MYCGD|nr:beta-lactamase [Mycolicibacterium goodii]
MTTTMTQIRSDLWQTRTDSPFPGLLPHAYLWKANGRKDSAGVMFYCPATDADFPGIDGLGGFGDQYLSHQDEAGPMLARIAEHYSARLHAPAAELANIAKHSPVHVPLDRRHRDGNGVEVIPTPGHSPGSTSYLVDGAEGRYLFTGDTVFVDKAGRWSTFVIPGIGDPSAMAESLRLLATLEPDVVISSAFGAVAVSAIDDRPWARCVEEAMESLAA